MLSLFAFLFAWYNIPFLVSLACFLLFSLLQIFAGGDDSDGDADADADADIDADADVDGPDAAERDVDVDGGGFFGEALAALGVGKLPLMLVMMAFMGSFGALGLLANTLLTSITGDYPAFAFIIILLGAFLLGLLLTGQISNLLARLAPRSSTAIAIEDLVGRSGIVTSPRVTSSYGRVSVRDHHGTLHTVFAVIDRGEPLPEQSEVALLAYDAKQRQFIVRSIR